MVFPKKDFVNVRSKGMYPLYLKKKVVKTLGSGHTNIPALLSFVRFSSKPGWQPSVEARFFLSGRIPGVL